MSARATGHRADSRRFLPPDPRVEEPYRLTPQIALRIAVLGALALAVFAILFLRLWALQVLSGSAYLESALNNQLRTFRVEAPRGPILDRNGKMIVMNAPGNSVQIWTDDLPNTWPARRKELRALGRVLGVPAPEIIRKLAEHKGDPLTPVTIQRGAHPDLVNYLAERENDFPGVQVVTNQLRKYPYQALAAHVLGYVGEISEPQLKEMRKDGYLLGDEIGQSGVEAAYDSYLRGKAGVSERRVDSLGRPRSAIMPKQQAEPGYALRLTLDIDLQRAAERALTYGIRLAHLDGNWAADGGAIVALDPRNGAVLALASNPTYQPNVYVSRDPDKLKPLTDRATAERANFPALDRALDGVYPPGSSWKPVTALAAMQEHLLSPYSTLPCTPTYTAYKQVFRNWTPLINQGMDLVTALAASCDTYFYELGKRFFDLPADRGHPFQAWASRLGFDQPTGIDIGGESAGLVPTPEWRQETYKGPNYGEIDRIWKPGYSVQLAIGQGDLRVTPIQMARFYALVANGGKLVTPHVVEDVEQPGGSGSQPRILRAFAPPTPRPVNVDPLALKVVRDGLYAATHSSIGTSSGVFGNFPVPIAGKTGTAEKVVDVPGYPAGHLESQSWWCGYGPASATDTPELVVCALIENGGHGGTAAAPAALKVFEKYFGKTAITTSHPSD
jgi:penicillin-binding protein 2